MAYRSYQGFKVTPIWVIIGVNFLLYIATAIVPVDEFLVLRPDSFSAGQWTIVTSLFIHAGFGHFAVNMLTLYFFGTFLSRLIGDRKFLLVYFGGGILGNILLILLEPFFPFRIALGASGAIFALGGVLTVMRPKLRVLVFFIIPAPLWLAVIGGFIILSFIPFIAWQAHLGGLVFGLIAGYFFRKKERYYF